MDALQNHSNHSPAKPHTLDIDEDHPKVADLLRTMKQEHQY